MHSYYHCRSAYWWNILNPKGCATAMFYLLEKLITKVQKCNIIWHLEAKLYAFLKYKCCVGVLVLVLLWFLYRRFKNDWWQGWKQIPFNWTVVGSATRTSPRYLFWESKLHTGMCCGGVGRGPPLTTSPTNTVFFTRIMSDFFGDKGRSGCW